jgi:hypothetical protein
MRAHPCLADASLAGERRIGLGAKPAGAIIEHD